MRFVIRRQHDVADVAPDAAPGTSPDGAVAERERFETFFHQHEQAVFGYLWRLTGEEQVAYDLSQETFFRAWQHFDRISAYERPGAWLLRVATNLALSHRRRASTVSPATPLDEFAHASRDDLASQFAERDAVYAALMALAPRARAALVLREIYGLSCTEVATALGISYAATKMTLSRAREQFRAHYLHQEVAR